jgi:hypothetical protein
MASPLDDPTLRSAMRTYLDAAAALEDAAAIRQPRELVDLAEAKALAGLLLRKRLGDLGFTLPSGQRSST